MTRPNGKKKEIVATNIEGLSAFFADNSPNTIAGTIKADKAKRKKQKKRKIAVLDFETDPFLFDRVPLPFCCEFLTEDGIERVFWNTSPEALVDEIANYLETLEQPYLIYAHNGGKFDFHFLHKYIDNPALIIKTRIVEAKLWHHTLRDSFAILPVPLKAYNKEDFDYRKMYRGFRDQYRKEILEYLHSDCVYLLELVTKFVELFGPQMTIGGTAVRELMKMHPFIKQGSNHDKTFRPYYFGGRVQVFKSGILKGPWKLIDLNSAYPAGMRNKKHPINGRFEVTDTLPDGFDVPYFLTFRGKNRNAIPVIAEDGSLDFTKEEGIFRVCSHELEIALKYDLIEIEEIIECLVSTESISFQEFVDKFFSLRQQAKLDLDKALDLFFKLILNSAYGRTGINPYNFEDWLIHRDFGNEEQLEADGYKQAADHEVIELWSRPADIKEDDFCDVAIAASITSSTRALLLEGIQNSVDAVYCDTDSLICRDFFGDVHPTRLGAWDLEKESKYAAIAGKKMFTLYNSEKDTKPIKLSSKGGTLSMKEIINMCKGETISQSRDAPTFSLKRQPKFQTRRFKMTA